jgi:hypothetical protein
MSSCYLRYNVFYAQKRGNELRHYEDAFALTGVKPIILDENPSPPPQVRGKLDPLRQVWRCAVADGATQGGFSRLWAQMLVDYYIEETPPLRPRLEGLEPWLKTMAKRWNGEKIEEILSTVPAGTPRRSRMEQSLRLEGQAATLVMLEIDPENRVWRAGAIGDAFLFHLRKRPNPKPGVRSELYVVEPVRPFANMQSDQLDTNPILISTRENNQDAWIWNNFAYSRDEAFVQSEFQPGDRFLIMTDAVAAYFLRVMEQNDFEVLRSELEYIPSLESKPGKDEEWLKTGRDTNPNDFFYLKNDDVTVLDLEITDESQGSEPVMYHPPRKGIVKSTQPASLPPVQQHSPTSTQQIPAVPVQPPTSVSNIPSLQSPFARPTPPPSIPGKSAPVPPPTATPTEDQYGEAKEDISRDVTVPMKPRATATDNIFTQVSPFSPSTINPEMEEPDVHAYDSDIKELEELFQQFENAIQRISQISSGSKRHNEEKQIRNDIHDEYLNRLRYMKHKIDKYASRARRKELVAWIEEFRNFNIDSVVFANMMATYDFFASVVRIIKDDAYSDQKAHEEIRKLYSENNRLFSDNNHQIWVVHKKQRNVKKQERWQQLHDFLSQKLSRREWKSKLNS